ncbi:hypothetical protein HUU62_05425 [Rhodoferax sp. 4810]|uniref:Uncharacterized protein n=1 Tax=Thiospirillum jenense TaxID=1653858 RepID=A0A839H7S0_9GAMM|nr:hypothetical protein [Thiospirillum jenense]MBB1073851.1 hypothetical protein [Rhodoferax jenense]MBB1125194.1 hypothetical protein [Thiospirillum jenense]
MIRIAKFVLLGLAIIAVGVIWQQTQLAMLALSQIDPVPKTRELLKDDHYADASSYLEFFMEYDYVKNNPEAQALWQEIEQVRGSWNYQAAKIGEGVLQGTSDETSGQVASVVSDFFVIGDLRDLANQGINAAQGEEVDEVLTALAAIGVVATAAQIASAGTATPAKVGVSVLKAARKLGQLPAWLGKALIDGAKTVKQTNKLDAVNDLFADVYVLAKTRGGLKLLSSTADTNALRQMATFAKTFGQQSVVLYQVGGQAAIKLAHRAGELGADTIKLAATFGQGGLRVLDKVGAIKFVKIASRTAKMVHKGDLLQLIAKLLLILPIWMLYIVVLLGAAVWLPWRWFYRFIQRDSATDSIGVHARVN